MVQFRSLVKILETKEGIIYSKTGVYLGNISRFEGMARDGPSRPKCQAGGDYNWNKAKESLISIVGNYIVEKGITYS